MISSRNSAESQYLTNCEDFIFKLVGNDIVLEIDYESDSVNDCAYLFIKFNSIEIKTFKIVEEVSTISLNLIPTTGTQVLEIGMIGKMPGDTVSQNGTIIRDTFIKFRDLKINNYKLLNDYDFFLNKTEYTITQNKQKVKPTEGFWEDATLKIMFDLPFDLWYNSVSTKNVSIPESLKFRSANNLDAVIEELEQSLKKLI